ncbi:MAG: hypothetical protein JWO07_770 [Candidatus Saccharibacteria bacterium]|nr:hypothetical protein [Candidatus Saccharibacteria bacterium]
MDKATGLRKRQQISHASQMMFLWIAGVSVVVGFCIVLIIFLGQRIWFGEKVITAKNTTASVLQKNLDTVQSLKDNVRVLNTNEALMSTRLNDTDPAIQSVLDALPADANSTAMASSLQTKLIGGVPGVTIESLKVDPVSGVETSATDTTVSNSDPSSNTIGFSFAVSTPVSSQDSLRQVLLNIEKSIRPFNITSLSVESQGQRVVMTAIGVGYYAPAQTVQLSQKVVRP